MYRCQLQFYLLGRDRALLDVIRGAAPLKGFTHIFTESTHPDASLCAGADVILLDLRGLDAPAALDALLPAVKEGADVLAAAATNSNTSVSIMDTSRARTWGRPATFWRPPSTACPT